MADPHDLREHHDEPHREAPNNSEAPRESTEVHQLPCVPNDEDMREMVSVIYAHAVHGLTELVWATPAPGTKDRQYLDNAQLFLLDDDSRDRMIEFAVSLNTRTNINCYLAPGVREETTDPSSAVRWKRRRHGEEDVRSVPALWTDCDDPGIYDGALEKCEQWGMCPSLGIITGEHPHRRGALYWVLDEPAGRDEFERIKDIHRRFVRLFKSDSNPALANPAALMRLAGSVAWPVKAGRRLEMTRIDRDAKRRAAAYTLNELDHLTRKALAETPAPATSRSGNGAGAAHGLDLDFSNAKPRLDAMVALDAAVTGSGHFHENALPVVMSWIARGMPGDLVYELVADRVRKAGENVEQRLKELGDMVSGAVRKVAAGRPSARAPDFDDETRPGDEFREAGHQAAREEFPFLTMADLLGPEPPRRWRIKGVMPMRGLGVAFGASGVFKSFLVSDIGLRVARGLGWFDRKVTQAPVCYVCGEGQSGYPSRVKAWVRERCAGMTEEELADIPFTLIPEPIDMLDAEKVKRLARKLRAMPNPPRLIIIDTLARCFGVGDESKTPDMNRFIWACGLLEHALDAFVLVVHHEGKDATKGERGSNSLRGAEDTRYRITRNGHTMECDLEIEKVKDGVAGVHFSPRMVSVVLGADEDGENVTSLVPVCEGGALERSAAGGGKLNKVERAILYALRDGPLRFGEIGKALRSAGYDTENMKRSLRKLRENKRVAWDDGSYELLIGADDDEDDDVLSD